MRSSRGSRLCVACRPLKRSFVFSPTVQAQREKSDSEACKMTARAVSPAC